MPGASTGQVPSWPRWLISDIAYEAIRPKEANIAKWLFASKLAVYPKPSITPERNPATGLVTSPPVWELVDLLATKHPKKHQNGHLSGSSGSLSPYLNCRKI
jgi:hypothetical protein